MPEGEGSSHGSAEQPSALRKSGTAVQAMSAFTGTLKADGVSDEKAQKARAGRIAAAAEAKKAAEE